LHLRFERSRKGSGEDEAYKKAVEGSHLQVAKKKSMLAGWVLDKAQCGKNFKTFQMEAMISKSAGLYADWLSQREAEEKYGKEQLKAMVEAGTIECRRMKSDPRFWEFKAKTERESLVVHGHKKTTIIAGGQKAISNDEVLAFSKVKTSQLGDGDFEFTEAAGGENAQGKLAIQDDLAKALNIKDKDKGNNNPSKTPKANKWETMSQINAAESKDEIKAKLVLFKGGLVKEHADLQKISLDLKAEGKKKERLACNKLADKIEHLVGSLNALIKTGNAKREDQKKALPASYQMMKEAKDSKSSFKKHLPKKEKTGKGKKAAEAKDDDDDEQEEEEEEED
jgi:hypothetical protein